MDETEINAQIDGFKHGQRMRLARVHGMPDDHPDFFNHVELLVEAGRLKPDFADRVWAAPTDQALDALVVEARTIVDEATQEGWI